MKLIITDIVDLNLKISGEYKLIKPQGKDITPCIGCFDCWFGTPGECPIRDGYGSMGSDLGKCDELIIISECFYGSVSPFVKNVLDRSIAYVAPDFDFVDGVMKHKRRYANCIKLTACFYGKSITHKEKDTAKRIMYANMDNFRAKVKEVLFFGSAEELAGVEF
ncbi:MAG: flavodoxin family protein [Clostridia bacterium]|nr:flavodoxin family protein [Clostridia bacterium]